LPFAQARWCGAAGVGLQALSAHKDDAFGRAYGVLVKGWRLLQRAVFVITSDDRLAHVEYVADQMAEPDYEAAVAAARAAAPGPAVSALTATRRQQASATPRRRRSCRRSAGRVARNGRAGLPCRCTVPGRAWDWVQPRGLRSLGVRRCKGYEPVS